MKKIMFVCLGNICRSPMAEFIFRDLVKKEGLEKEIARAEGKLNNAGFVSKAPAALVQQERDKLAANQVKAASLRKRIDELKESL